MTKYVVGSKCVFALVLMLLSAGYCFAQNYQMTNLTSDIPGNAPNTDANLVNAWGLSRGTTTPWWISDNGKGKATLYDGTGAPNPVANPLIVTIPAAKESDTGTPTGTIFNGTTSFELQPKLPARFLFATEDGTISGWNSMVDPTNAVIKVRTPKGVYKGLAAASFDDKLYLYATNFSAGRVDVFDANFQPVHLRHDAFRLDCDSDDFFRKDGPWKLFRSDNDDSWLFRNLVPYNIQNIGGTLFVTFALPDADRHDNVAGAGLGLVAAFTPRGRLVRVFQHGPFLNGPWGLTLAPSDFGGFSHALLVGQFSSGEIVAYNIETGAFIGKALDPMGKTIVIDGLWALSFGSGGTSGPANTLFFTAGPEDESHGLFGSLTAVPSTQLLGNGL